MILAEGRVVAAGPVDELSRRGAERYRVELDGEDAAWLRDVRGVNVVDVDGSVALLDLDGLDAADLARTVVSRSPVIELSRARQPLSDIFREAIR